MPMGSDTQTIRAAGAGVAEVPGRILVAARLVEKKGVHVLLRALRELPAGIPWSLDVLGDGPMRPELEALAAGLPVRFLGQRSRAELGVALHEAEVFVVPSVPAASGDQDGLPVVLLDAMAAGCAVVASRLPGIDEAVEDGRSGVLLDPGDEVALRSAIAALLTDDGRRHALATAARTRSDLFSVDALGERYVELIRSVAR
jgi:glycosyltransferase involved in cell wall biosynthesis